MYISTQRPCVRNIDSPRSKRCKGESILFKPVVSGRYPPHIQQTPWQLKLVEQSVLPYDTASSFLSLKPVRNRRTDRQTATVQCKMSPRRKHRVTTRLLPVVFSIKPIGFDWWWFAGANRSIRRKSIIREQVLMRLLCQSNAYIQQKQLGYSAST